MYFSFLEEKGLLGRPNVSTLRQQLGDIQFVISYWRQLNKIVNVKVEAEQINTAVL